MRIFAMMSRNKMSSYNANNHLVPQKRDLTNAYELSDVSNSCFCIICSQQTEQRFHYAKVETADCIPPSV